MRTSTAHAVVCSERVCSRSKVGGRLIVILSGFSNASATPVPMGVNSIFR
jgi:hypothetical protein